MNKDKDYVLRGAFKEAVYRGMSVGARYAAECVYWGAEQGVKEIIRAIDEIPAANVKPVVMGEWVTLGNGQLVQCSVCKYINAARSHNFCPNCGAEMEANDER